MCAPEKMKVTVSVQDSLSFTTLCPLNSLAITVLASSQSQPFHLSPSPPALTACLTMELQLSSIFSSLAAPTVLESVKNTQVDRDLSVLSWREGPGGAG